MTKAEQHGRKAAAWGGQDLSPMQRAERTLRDTIGAAQQSAAEGEAGAEGARSCFQQHMAGWHRDTLLCGDRASGAALRTAQLRCLHPSSTQQTDVFHCTPHSPDLGMAESSTIAPCFSGVCHLWDGHSQECPRAEGVVTFGIPCMTFAP